MFFNFPESDLEAVFEECIIRKSLKAIFPNQVIFQRRSIRVGAEIVHYHKLRFLNLDIGLYTVELLRNAIMNQLPYAAQDKNGDEKEEEKADGMMQYVIIKLRHTSYNYIRYSILKPPLLLILSMRLFI